MGADQQKKNLDDCHSLGNAILNSIMKKLNSLPHSPMGRCCIYKVHEKFRKLNQHAYTPELVSIGPFHHDKLHDMQHYKLRYMNELLTRTGNKEAKLLECIEAISSHEDDIRKCYSNEFELDRDKFVEIIIVDALFIIELFGKSVGEEKIQHDDPIFNRVWIMSSLVRDIVLLENQLPMFVLDKLFGITMGNFSREPLAELTIHFFNPLMPIEEKVLVEYFKSGKHLNTTACHLLDLVSKTLHNLHVEASGKQIDDPNVGEIPSITELRQGGIKIRKRSDSGNFLDIRFNDGVLEIPPILVQDQTDTLLRNLIALEQCSDGCDAYITSYALLMNRLVRSSNDVEFLRKVGIVTNYLGDDECVWSLFNTLCGELTLVDFHYSHLCYRLNSCYTKRRNGCFAPKRLAYKAWERMVNACKVHGKFFRLVL